MLCEHYKDALTEVAASGAAPQGELLAHLGGCASCRAAFDEEQSLIAAIDSGVYAKANAEVPVTLLPRVRGRLDEAVTTQRAWMHPLVLASAGMALAFLLLFVGWPHSPAPNNVAKQTPSTSTPMAPMAGTHKDISPSNVQVASTATSHLHMSRTSTVVHSAASSSPEVLVPPDEREALARLVATLNEHSDIAAALTAHVPEEKDTVINADPLQIPDMEIKPLEGTDATTPDDAVRKR